MVVPYSQRGEEYKRKQTEYKREWRARKKLNSPTIPAYQEPRAVRHGTTTEYRYGCRCDECREAMNIYWRVNNGGTAPKNPGAYGVIKSTSGGNKHEDKDHA
jgi:hypothetical protein